MQVGPAPAAPGTIVNVNGLSITGGPHFPHPCDPIPGQPPNCGPQNPGSDPYVLHAGLEDDSLQDISCPVGDNLHPDRAWLATRLAPFFTLRDDPRPLSGNVTPIPGFDEPSQLMNIGRLVFGVHVVDFGTRASEIRVIDTRTNKVLATWKMPGAANQIDHEGDDIYALDEANAVLYAAHIGVSLDDIPWRAIPLPKGDPNAYSGRSFTVHAGRAYVSAYSQERIDVIDVSSGAVVATTREVSCSPVFVNVVDDLLIATSNATGIGCGPNVAAFSLTDLHRVYGVKLPGQPESVVPAGGKLFIGGLEKAPVVVLDARSGATLRTLPVVGARAMGVFGSTLVVGDQHGVMRSYGADTGTPCASAFVLNGPHRTWPALQSIAFDLFGTAYVANYNDGAVDAVKGLLCR